MLFVPHASHASLPASLRVCYICCLLGAFSTVMSSICNILPPEYLKGLLPHPLQTFTEISPSWWGLPWSLTLFRTAKPTNTTPASLPYLPTLLYFSPLVCLNILTYFHTYVHSYTQSYIQCDLLIYYVYCLLSGSWLECNFRWGWGLVRFIHSHSPSA